MADETSIIWDPSEYNLTYVLDNFELPQMVRIIQGFMINEEDALEYGTILTLHGETDIKKLKGCDDRGRNIYMPLNCQHKVQVCAENDKEGIVYNSVQELLSVYPESKCFKVLEQVTHNRLNLAAGSKIIIENVEPSHNANRKKQLIGIVDNHGGQKVMLPLDTKGQFVPCLLSYNENKTYLIQELVGHLSFPFQIRFLDGHDRDSEYGQHLGVISVKEILRSTVVMATMNDNGVRYAVTFPRNFPVTIQIAKGMVEDTNDTYSQICQKIHEEIDKEVLLDLLLNGSIFSGEFMYEVCRYTENESKQLAESEKLPSPPCRKLPVELDIYQEVPVTQLDSNPMLTTRDDAYTYPSWIPPCKNHHASKVAPRRIPPAVPPRTNTRSTETNPYQSQKIPSISSGISENKAPIISKGDYNQLHDRVENPYTFDNNCTNDVQSSDDVDSIDSAIAADENQIIRHQDEEGVCMILDKLNLSDYQEIFRDTQINGEFLVELEEDDFVRDLGMTKFQARKLVKFVNGWRPDQLKDLTTFKDTANSLDPCDWSSSDVMGHLKMLNLQAFSDFCQENQINGQLLKEILDKEMLQHIREHYGIKISILEEKKLQNFVLKAWRPDKFRKSN